MTLVVSIVELASAFDLITVAEGVETAAQLAALRGLRCSHAQGFLHSPAVPAQELEQMLVLRNGLRQRVPQGKSAKRPQAGLAKSKIKTELQFRPGFRSHIAHRASPVELFHACY